jgi:hypothetical protein
MERDMTRRDLGLGLCLVVVGAAALAALAPMTAADGTRATDGPDQVGCAALPADNVWNARVDEMPVDPRSDAYIATIGADRSVHPDFGSGLYDGRPIGIPYVTVPGDQLKVPVTFQYAGESDPGPYPVPTDAPIEGGPTSDGDRHVLVVDREACVLYELYSAYPQRDGSWQAGSGAVFDLGSNDLRPETWTSADAAGLPIWPGLVRYDEVAAGEIRHAVRFTVPATRRAYVWPARHYASDRQGSELPPMGQRFRLRADYDLSAASPQVRTILTALKRYGMILADNGSAWFISGAPDARWDNDALLEELRRVRGRNFEAVDVSSLMADAGSGRVRGADAASATPSPRATGTATVPEPSPSTAAAATGTAPEPSPTPRSVTPTTVVPTPAAPTAAAYLPLIATGGD